MELCLSCLNAEEMRVTRLLGFWVSGRKLKSGFKMGLEFGTVRL